MNMRLYLKCLVACSPSRDAMAQNTLQGICKRVRERESNQLFFFFFFLFLLHNHHRFSSSLYSYYYTTVITASSFFVYILLLLFCSIHDPYSFFATSLFLVVFLHISLSAPESISHLRDIFLPDGKSSKRTNEYQLPSVTFPFEYAWIRNFGSSYIISLQRSLKEVFSDLYRFKDVGIFFFFFFFRGGRADIG